MLKVRVEGRLVLNNTDLMLNAALAGLGLAYLPEDLVRGASCEGRLVRALDDWCPPFPGLSPLLSQPAAADAGFRLAGRRLALSRGLTDQNEKAGPFDGPAFHFSRAIRSINRRDGRS